MIASRRLIVCIMVVGMLASTPASPVVAAQEAPPLPPNCAVVASDLVNPRFVAVAADGTLFVSESGIGGDEELYLPPAFAEVAAPEAEAAGTPATASPIAPEAFGFRGDSGQVTMVAPDGAQTVIATGLPSYAFGLETIGPAGIAVKDDTVWLAVGGAGPLTPAVEPLPLENAVVRIDPATGAVASVADIGAYERANDPEPFAIDSNLYGLAVAPDSALIVADAGGNAVYRVDPASGALSVLAVIPGIPLPAGMEPPEGGNPMRGGAAELDPVPTGIAVADDNTILVGLLAALVTDAAEVLRLAEDGTLSSAATGLSNVVDVAIAPDGTLYASQISTDFAGEMPAPGNVVRIEADGTAEAVLGDLPFPNGIAFDQSGALYVVINAISIDSPQGQVLRCELASAAA